jgi:hypothetical protein
LAKAPVVELPRIVSVLRGDWAIETEGVMQLRDLAGSGAFAEPLLHRIARHNVDERKDQRQNEPQRGQGEQKTLGM